MRRRRHWSRHVRGWPAALIIEMLAVLAILVAADPGLLSSRLPPSTSRRSLDFPSGGPTVTGPQNGTGELAASPAALAEWSTESDSVGPIPPTHALPGTPAQDGPQSASSPPDERQQAPSPSSSSPGRWHFGRWPGAASAWFGSTGSSPTSTTDGETAKGANLNPDGLGNGSMEVPIPGAPAHVAAVDPPAEAHQSSEAHQNRIWLKPVLPPQTTPFTRTAPLGPPAWNWY